MPVKVLVPRLGEGVEEITITRWLKHEGDPVRELEPLLEVNTDKVDTEIPCPAGGTLLRIEMQEGQTAKVGEVLALISSSGSETDVPLDEVPPLAAGALPGSPFVDDSQHAISAADLGTNRHSSMVNGQLGFISPVVSKIAAEYGLDLRQVRGTGLGGRITKNDVLALVGSGNPLDQPVTNLPINQSTDYQSTNPPHLSCHP